MKSRQFTREEQVAFIKLSGDNNPLHSDPVVARRTLFGEPVVHGVHLLMWALDQWLEGRDASVCLEKLQVAFLKPIALNQEVQISLVSEQGHCVRFELFREGEVAVRGKFKWSTHEPSPADRVSPDFPEQHPPDFLSLEAIKSCSGHLDLYWHRATSEGLFPNLSRLFSPVQSAVLLGMTRLVGVKCPGLQSIFSELELSNSAAGDLQRIRYAVSEVDERVGLVLIGVEAPGLCGTVKAFIRALPQSQATFLDIKAMVQPEEFSGQQALVVGGSRGLGEVTAKLLSAGGASVQLTYHLGKEDALKVAEEIQAGGGKVSICEFDIFRAKDAPAELTAPSHLYYFPSPIIAAAGKRHFSPALFQSFCRYYVTGFADIIEHFHKEGLKNVFYPSSVYIDELPPHFTEYAMAKSSGEVMCAAFGKIYPEMHFFHPRLPKMATDQTLSLLPANNLDPAPILLAVLRQFTDSSRA